ncbi:MAG: glycosyltransferase [Paludibacteraceae bacterium]|nr:glycosyltransferase [Paludibacteraceae bacterium]
MKLSIITINYNNAEGLRRTLASVAVQTYHDIEHIIVDGGSTDGSVNVIEEYESSNRSSVHPLTIIWSSEPDKGIYDGMNRGIRKATGDYVQILNSGDILAANDVTERMLVALDSLNAQHSTLNEDAVSILYGNMIKKDYTTGKILGKSGVVEYSLRNYYSGTMNHDCCYIRRDMFDIYGLYDENLKIVSDWKWFLQAIGLGNVKPKYVDIDVTIFDASGVSETNLELRNKERRQVLEELLPPAVLADYDAHAFEIEQMTRLRRRHMYELVYFIERALFKLEKWHILR